MGAFTVCPEWNDSCVVIAWKVAKEGGSMASFCQTLDWALQLSAGANFWSNNFKIELFDQNDHHYV